MHTSKKETNMKSIDIESFIKKRTEMLESQKADSNSTFSFVDLCQKIKEAFFTDWDKGESAKATLEIQKKAIIGYAKEVQFFKVRIIELINEFHAENTKYPLWYGSLEEGVYHENWGLAGISEWFLPAFAQSSSAKIIGDRIYFLQDGKMCLRRRKFLLSEKNNSLRLFFLRHPKKEWIRFITKPTFLMELELPYLWNLWQRKACLLLCFDVM